MIAVSAETTKSRKRRNALGARRKVNRLWANLRSCEILRLVYDRTPRGAIDAKSVEQIVYVAACALYHRAPPRGASSGLDCQTFEDWACRSKILPLLNQYCPHHWEVIERAHKAMARGPLSSERAAKALRVTADERRRLGIITMGAIDETPAQRSAGQKIARKCRQALRRHRQAVVEKGRPPTPRAAYEAASLSRAKPWEAEGVSRRTWYRRRQVGTGACPTNTISPRYESVGHGLVPRDAPRRTQQTRLSEIHAQGGGLSCGLVGKPSLILPESDVCTDATVLADGGVGEVVAGDVAVVGLLRLPVSKSWRLGAHGLARLAGKAVH